MLLARCDVVSAEDRTARTDIINTVKPEARSAMRAAAGLTFRDLDFSQWSLDGFDFSGCTLQRCVFGHGSFLGARFEGARFFDCRLPRVLYDLVRYLSVEMVDTQIVGSEEEPPEPQEDPVSYLIGKFFKRFIRRERGRFQATVGQSSVLQALSSEERKFTQREIVPKSLSVGIIRRVPDPPVYEFNSDWQAEGDALLFDQEVGPDLSPLIEDLKVAARRYSL